MPEIVIENLFELKISTSSDTRKVIDLIHENGIDWMHACGKKGRCTTCKMIVLEGESNLAPANDREELFLNQGRLVAGERLSCQSTLVKGTLKIRVAERNKFPHMEYSQ